MANAQVNAHTPELPLDHGACIEANLRYAHAQSGSPLAFEVAIRIPHVLRCLENAVHANIRKLARPGS